MRTLTASGTQWPWEAQAGCCRPPLVPTSGPRIYVPYTLIYTSGPRRPKCPRRRLCPLHTMLACLVHISIDTIHSYKGPSLPGIWDDVYSRTDNVCPALLSLSLFDSSVSFQTSARPNPSLFVLYGPFRPRSRAFFGPTMRTTRTRHIVHQLSNQTKAL